MKTTKRPFQALFKPTNVQSEIKLRHKEYFESMLALAILQSITANTSIDKVSQKILELLHNHPKSALAEIIDFDKKISSELYGKEYFGHLPQKKSNSDDIAFDILHYLADPNTPAETKIQIHCIFVHRIFERLQPSQEQLNKKNNVVNNIFYSTLFSSKERGRQKLEQALHGYDNAGISRNLFYQNKLPMRNSVSCAISCFKPDTKSALYQEAMQHNLPLVSGYSGHTGSLLLGATVYGALNIGELQHYALAVFAMLTAGSHHSFHEVMSVARLFNIHYRTGDYASAISDELKSDAAIQSALSLI